MVYELECMSASHKKCLLGLLICLISVIIMSTGWTLLADIVFETVLCH